MPKFRKKPVVIEARQLYAGSFVVADRLAEWCGGVASHVTEETGDGEAMEWPSIMIPTLEGDMVAHVGDWIIKGVNGEFYPCKPDIFEKTYEPANSAAQNDTPSRPVSGGGHEDLREQDTIRDVSDGGPPAGPAPERTTPNSGVMRYQPTGLGYVTPYPKPSDPVARRTNPGGR